MPLVFRMAKGKKTQGFYSLLQVMQQSQRKTGPGARGTICSELSKMKLCLTYAQPCMNARTGEICSMKN